VADHILIGPEERDLETIKRVAGDLVANPDTNYVLVDEQHSEVKLPSALVRVLMEAARQLAKGNSVSILHYEQELTTQQAADLLQVSRPYLIRLLEEGKIRHHLVGSHRRIRLGDLLDYKSTRDSLRTANIREMVRVSESLGLYEADEFDEREP
jgi:excisionase family DNA binding protein